MVKQIRHYMVYWMQHYFFGGLSWTLENWGFNNIKVLQCSKNLKCRPKGIHQDVKEAQQKMRYSNRT